MKHYKLRIQGLVQGVWYRASARRKAEELGLSGFVRNESDGSVYAEAEGEEAALQAFVQWCREGPEQARVEEVEVEEGTPQGFTNFYIQR
ncbi:MAG: acylphosphatase [Lewinellaceae bacterium]|nr:acylphosphatase [Phaeodactylibacter sp.]MCB9350955.1 acylphosphatase [Lewinellaceae bacterium]